MFDNKKTTHTYVITYEDYRGEIFEDDFETEVDTIEEAKELYLDEDRDICILDIKKID